MLQGEHSAILLPSIKVPFVIKIFVLSIFEWPFYTGFTVFKMKWTSLCDCGTYHIGAKASFKQAHTGASSGAS